MPRTPIGSMRLTPEAEARITELSARHTIALTTQAKALAYYRQDDMVLPNHVNGAYQGLRLTPGRNWKQETSSALGWALFGVGASLFVSELLKGPAASHSAIAISALICLIGLSLVVVGLMLSIFRP